MALALVDPSKKHHQHHLQAMFNKLNSIMESSGPVDQDLNKVSMKLRTLKLLNYILHILLYFATF